jgi:hypothetical protein
MLAERQELELQSKCCNTTGALCRLCETNLQVAVVKDGVIDSHEYIAQDPAVVDSHYQTRVQPFFRILKEKLYDHHNKDQKQVSHRINYDNLTKSKKLYICSMKISVKTNMIDDDLCLFLNQKRQEYNGRILYQRGPRGGGMPIAVKPLMHWVARPSLTFRIY